MATKNKEYHNWMLDLIQSDDPNFINYSTVLRELNDTLFYCVGNTIELKKDEQLINRVKEMRRYWSNWYYNASYQNYDFFNSDVSVLEIMINLSISINAIMMTDETQNNTSYWFWSMVKSLGLLEYPDYKNNNVSNIKYAIDCFLKRDYSIDGEGSLFYIPGTLNDLREKSIWMQGMEWLTKFHYDDV